MRPRSTVVLCTMVATLLCGLAVLLSPEGSPLRTPAAALLVLALPGYLIQAAWFAGSGFRAVERGVLSVGLSIVVCILDGLALDRLPAGLTTTTWVGGLLGISCVAGASALLRDRRRLTPTPIDWHRFSLPSTRASIGMAASALLCASAVGVVAYGVANEPKSGFSQMWLTPTTDQTTRAVELGIRNNEGVQSTYRVRVEADGTLIGVWPAVELAPGQQWQITVALPADASAAASVSAALFRATDSDAAPPYRRALVWLSRS